MKRYETGSYETLDGQWAIDRDALTDGRAWLIRKKNAEALPHEEEWPVHETGFGTKRAAVQRLTEILKDS